MCILLLQILLTLTEVAINDDKSTLHSITNKRIVAENLYLTQSLVIKLVIMLLLNTIIVDFLERSI